MDEFSSGLAARFGAIADTFGEWRKPETARAVLESLLTGDREALRELLPDPLDPPDPRIPRGPRLCRFILEMVEIALEEVTVVSCTRLRTDLSHSEKHLYIAIVLSCLRDGCLPPLEATDLTEIGACKGMIIPPGQFLERLAEAGLVEECECTVDGKIGLQLTPPAEMCAY
jgi:hypothetical protein